MRRYSAIHVSDMMDEALLKQMVDEKYIRVQSHPQALDLKIYNYAEKAVYEKVWNEATLQCRGLIMNGSGLVVARPWRKFFNLQEVNAEFVYPVDLVEITDKMDGSLGIGYQAGPGDWRIATRGSFASDQALWATQFFKENYVFNPQSGYTPLWEIIYPQNRIVLDYGRYEGLVLLGCVSIQGGRYYGPYEAAGMLGWPGLTTEVLPYDTMEAYLASPDAARENAEGVVVRSGNKMVKIKQEDYIRAHAVVTGLSNRKIWESLAAGESLPEQASFMPDEFYNWMTETAGQLLQAKAEWIQAAEQEYEEALQKCRTREPNRKTFALVASASPFRAALFRLYDGATIDDLAWKAIRPVEIVRPFTQSEATA